MGGHQGRPHELVAREVIDISPAICERDVPLLLDYYDQPQPWRGHQEALWRRNPLNRRARVQPTFS